MTPSTRALIDYMRDDGRTDEPDMQGLVDDEPEATREMMALQIKKKRHQMMLKEMLANSGYGDLAKMVNIRREKYELPDEDEAL